MAISFLSGISGLPVATLREGQKQIPVVTRLRMDERAQLADLHNLHVYAAQSAQKVPLLEVAGHQSTLATPLSAARRAAVRAPVLRANRRLERRDLY